MQLQQLVHVPTVREPICFHPYVVVCPTLHPAMHSEKGSSELMLPFHNCEALSCCMTLGVYLSCSLSLLPSPSLLTLSLAISPCRYCFSQLYPFLSLIHFLPFSLSLSLSLWVQKRPSDNRQWYSHWMPAVLTGTAERAVPTSLVLLVATPGGQR